jgi:hypothetical protein
MKKVLLILLTLSLCVSSNAQKGFRLPEPTGPDFDRGISLFLVLPAFMTSTSSNINPLLLESGYPAIPRSSFNYGLGLNYRIKRFETGFDFAIGNQNRSNPILNSELLRRSLSANFTLNYHIKLKNSFTLFPFVGYSFIENNLFLSKPTPDDDFGSLLQNPSTSVNLLHFSDGIILGMGVSISQFWREATSTMRLKFSYRIPTNTGYFWESSFSNFQQSPLDNFPYFNIQFEMGVLGNWKKGAPWMDDF